MRQAKCYYLAVVASHSCTATILLSFYFSQISQIDTEDF